MNKLIRTHQSVSQLIVIAYCIACICGLAVPASANISRCLLLVSLLVASSVHDALYRRIPNGLTYATILCGSLLIVMIAISSSNSGPLIDSCLAVLLCGSLMFVGWSLRAIGGGDVKLVVAMAILLGLSDIVASFFFAHLAAFLYIATQSLRNAFSSLVIRSSTAPSGVSAAAFSLNARIPMAGFYAIGTGTTLLIHLVIR